MPSLSQLRKQIDRLDDQIVALLNRRLGLAEQIGGLKLLNGDKVYNQQREKQLLTRLCEKQDGLLTSLEIRSIYRQILFASRAHQKRVFRQPRKSIRLGHKK